MILKTKFKKEFFPFQSRESKIKVEDFISREEIEMAIFLSSFLEDMVKKSFQVARVIPAILILLTCVG